MKQCSKCGEIKAEESFSWKIKDVRRAGVCKDCHRQYRKEHYENNKQKYVDKAKKWSLANPDKSGWHHPTYVKHGLTEAEFQELKEKFNGLCWICKERPGTDIDHDHKCCSAPTSCGKCVRGFLCSPCNKALGFFGDRLDVVANAMLYLEGS